ncbi:hypothetical protein FIV00_12610 [Labrenzia sp. THAF82]|uniref:hypothetical protein n=1 Tax=Labrenzia sp. THAF82 TaxID=2587861 RepID=UPI0012A8C387|nr:hypothetical protein [Labrenzia sp. THAF82]QFT31326.1 hypothetical protein FIV00_12610 [Labrenzia sp. THAF82]
MLESISQEISFFKLKQLVTKTSASLVLLVCLGIQAGAQSVYEPARGTPERGDILNAVRPMLEARVGPPVEFVVDWMRAGNGWAFVQVSPQRPGGGTIDLRSTTYAQQAEYMDGLATFALLRFQYNRWNLIDFVVGPTDVFWHGDPLYGRLPQGLVPY